MKESKLIASTMTFRNFTLDEALERLAEVGFDKAELCSVGDWVPHFDMVNATDKSIAACVASFKNAGIRAVAINTGLLPAENPDLLTADRAEAAFALAKELGAEVVTLSCGSPIEGYSREKLLARYTEFNTRLADFGDEYGVTCAIEAPHKLTVAETVAQLNEYWSMQDSRVKCTFDCAHLTYSGEDMLAVAERYKNRVVQIHLRDAVKGNSLRRYGEGTVDFGAFVEIFKKNGYGGYFSMEYPPETREEAVERITSSVEFLRKFDI